MLLRSAFAALALSASLGLTAPALAAPAAAIAAPAEGVIRLRSSHSFDETVTRLKAAVGRSYEGYAADPALVVQYARAITIGLQGPLLPGKPLASD